MRCTRDAGIDTNETEIKTYKPYALRKRITFDVCIRRVGHTRNELIKIIFGGMFLYIREVESHVLFGVFLAVALILKYNLMNSSMDRR